MSKECINYYDEETVKDMIAVAVDSLFGNSPRDPKKVFPHIVLPAKHGRLIDADALKSKIIEQRYLDNPRREKFYNKVLDFIFDATTILGAST